jgi:hypothetical protein
MVEHEICPCLHTVLYKEVEIFQLSKSFAGLHVIIALLAIKLSFGSIVNTTKIYGILGIKNPDP